MAALVSSGRRSGASAAVCWYTSAAAVCYIVSAVLCCTVAAYTAGKFCDLHVYRLGGHDVLSGMPLSQVNYAGYMPFTYPPAAALIFTVLAVPPWTATAALATGVSAAGFAATLYLALRLRPVSSWLSRGAAARLALAAGAAAIWLEPVRTTLAYGQINVLLTLLILYDLSRPDTARLKGAAIGLAAGIKLTPAIFAVYLLATRRYRAAAVAAAVLAVTIAAGYAVLPSSSAWYWDMTFLNPAHVGAIQLTMNQSLLGALARGLHTTNVRPLWLALIVLAGLAGLALAARAGRAGDEAGGFSLCAVTGLLASPISWTHHWVIVVPSLLLAVVTTWHRGTVARWSPAVRTASLVRLTVLAGVAAIGWTRLVRRVPEPSGPLHLSLLHFVTGDGYVLIGLGVLAMAASSSLARPGQGVARPRGTARASGLSAGTSWAVSGQELGCQRAGASVGK